jgi:hypothetical protein
MARTSRLLVLLVLGTLSQAPRAFTQEKKTEPSPPTAASGDAAAPEVLPGLPRPPDAPRSLLQGPPAAPPYSCDPLPGPYFERDPEIDPPTLPPPGWFGDVELGIVVPHVKNQLVDVVQIGTNAPDTVMLTGADLNWTVAPRFEVGYRLPSGFGEFAVAYRFLASEGTQTVLGVDAPAALKSRLDLNVIDLDYASREFHTYQFPNLEMKWRFGLRWANVYFDSRAVEPFDAAAAGSGVFEQRSSNSYWGIGPHAGLELSRRFQDSGLSLIGKVDGATLLGRIRQGFFETSTTAGPDGQLLTGTTRESGSQSVPMLNTFVGLRWDPPRNHKVHVLLGYEYEYWWNVGRDSATASRAAMFDQGVLLRAEFNY